ncbi:MAG: hypothetical protein ACRD3G_05740 [Vicinamibacterales bacterium]
MFDLASVQSLPHETPFFAISEQLVRQKYEELARCFTGARIHYVVKANAEPDVLRPLAKAGSGFEIGSRLELDLLSAFDVSPDRVVSGSSVKPLRDLVACAAGGVTRFACDSFEELDKLAECAPGAQVYVRIAVDGSGHVTSCGGQFGASPALAKAILVRTREVGLRPYGLSFHLGSCPPSARAWARALDDLGPVLGQLAAAGVPALTINIGGGFPSRCLSSATGIEMLSGIARHTLDAYRRLPYRPQLILAPGRGLAAESTILVTRVIARIPRGRHTWLFLDAGVRTGLPETINGTHRYRISSFRRTDGDEGAMMKYCLAGPTGDIRDVVARDAWLPADLRPGDRLVFHDVGAVRPRDNGLSKPGVYSIEPEMDA